MEVTPSIGPRAYGRRDRADEPTFEDLRGLSPRFRARVGFSLAFIGYGSFGTCLAAAWLLGGSRLDLGAIVSGLLVGPTSVSVLIQGVWHLVVPMLVASPGELRLGWVARASRIPWHDVRWPKADYVGAELVVLRRGRPYRVPIWRLRRPDAVRLFVWLDRFAGPAELEDIFR